MGHRKIRGRIVPRKEDSSTTVGLSKDNTQSIDNSPPVFSLRYLQKGYCVDSCQKNEKAALADTLFKLSSCTWSDIRKLPRHGLGFEKISRASLKEAVPKHITDDVEFIAFRFCAKAPMVGYKMGATFYIVWLDRTFTLYTH